MDVTELQANANKCQKAASMRRSMSKVIKRYANEVQGIQTRREEE